LLVTTSYDPQREQFELAERLAEEAGSLVQLSERVQFVPRKRYSLSRLSEHYGDPSILLVSKQRIEFYHGQQHPLFFHPSTAAIRVKRLLYGDPDTLVELSRLQSGDRVLDCTAGLGSDAIVYSYALGGNGQVVALESQAIPYLLLHQGLMVYDSDIPGMNEALRRIKVLQADHYEFLRHQPDKTFDVIYFDPMFRRPIEQSDAIGAIRRLADPRPVSEQTVREAVRVARRTIVLKEHRDSKEFDRLGFGEVHRSTTKIAYGVIRL
jgi:16S rRNA (guanine1516-N2)-methyltransferase